MKTKYLKYTLQGELSADEAVRELGEAASHGTVVRFDNRGGQTHLYLAFHGIGSAVGHLAVYRTDAAVGTKKIAAEVEEVSELDVTKIT